MFIFKSLDHFNEWHFILSLFPVFVFNQKFHHFYRYKKALLFIFFSYLFLILFKGTLRIPHPIYKHTFAFPSGHCWMIPVVIYAVFRNIFQYSRKQTIIITSFIAFMEVGICIYNKHHELLDCLGGLGGATVCIFLYEMFCWRINKKIFIVLLDAIAVYSWFYLSRVAPAYFNNNIRDLLSWGILTNLFFLLDNKKKGLLLK